MRGDGNDGRKKVLARGTVRVDPKAALAKMRAYQLADPVAYVLEVVRAAVWAGAKEVHLENDSDDLVVWHDGPAPHADDLARILEHLFSVDDRRLRLLAVAVNTALGLGCAFSTCTPRTAPRRPRPTAFAGRQSPRAPRPTTTAASPTPPSLLCNALWECPPRAFASMCARPSASR
jgi:hypothetical protein